MKDPRIEALEHELARQDAALAAALAELSALGDIEFAIPEESLQAIDEACVVRPPTPRAGFVVRG